MLPMLDEWLRRRYSNAGSSQLIRGQVPQWTTYKPHIGIHTNMGALGSKVVKPDELITLDHLRTKTAHIFKADNHSHSGRKWGGFDSAVNLRDGDYLLDLLDLLSSSYSIWYVGVAYLAASIRTPWLIDSFEISVCQKGYKVNLLQRKTIDFRLFFLSHSPVFTHLQQQCLWSLKSTAILALHITGRGSH